ncbi:MAG: hypothetical protein ABF593_04615 [Acetobacter papayae]|uniref:hypothetical protein n=1 Tax=Acetobacter papayae TaxID=1076592 RepID=UPI0039E988FE
MNDEEFDVWLAKEKRALADEAYKETIASFDRIKARLGAILPLSVTLTTASLAGAFSRQDYSLVCSFLSLGFGSTAMICAAGLSSTTLLSKNFDPDAVDRVLEDVTERDVKSASLALAFVTFAVNEECIKTIKRDRRWLKAAWIALSLTPPASFFLSTAWGCLRGP